jgi:hypothetical protein
MASVTSALNRPHSLGLDVVTSMEPFTAPDPVKLANTLMARFIVLPWANPAITSMAESTAVPIVNILTAQCIVHREAPPVQHSQLARQHRPGVAEL